MLLVSVVLSAVFSASAAPASSTAIAPPRTPDPFAPAGTVQELRLHVGLSSRVRASRSLSFRPARSTPKLLPPRTDRPVDCDANPCSATERGTFQEEQRQQRLRFDMLLW